MIVKREDIFEEIRRLVALKFYGALTLKFEAGKIVSLKKEETIKVTPD